MQIGKASGTQVAFFTFAALLLLVPLTKWIVKAHEWTPGQAALIDRGLPIVLGVALLFGIPPLRRWCGEQLGRSIPAARRGEVLAITVAGFSIAFATVGALVIWAWMAEGPAGVAQRVRAYGSHEAHLARSFTALGLAFSYLLAGFIGPIVEELVFRGLLYRAWERQWGWLVAMLLSSIVFGFYHGEFWHAFLAGLVWVALYRRTGTLRATILAHIAYNVTFSYPVLGQFVLRLDAEAPGDLDGWSFHVACLMFVAIAIPAYIFMARGTHANAPAFDERAGEPLPR